MMNKRSRTDDIRCGIERYKNVADELLPVDPLEWLNKKPDEVPEYHLCLDWLYPEKMYMDKKR